MGIQLPAELAGVAAAAGVRWPQADETAMAASATTWRTAAGQLSTLGTDADGAAQSALNAVDGDAADAARRHWDGYVSANGRLSRMVRGSNAAADRLEHGAEQIGAAKVEIIRQLIALKQQQDAAQQAHAAGHPNALAGLNTLLAGTSSTLAQLQTQLAAAVRLDSGVTVGEMPLPGQDPAQAPGGSTQVSGYLTDPGSAQEQQPGHGQGLLDKLLGFVDQATQTAAGTVDATTSTVQGTIPGSEQQPGQPGQRNPGLDVVRPLDRESTGPVPVVNQVVDTVAGTAGSVTGGQDFGPRGPGGAGDPGGQQPGGHQPGRGESGPAGPFGPAGPAGNLVDRSVDTVTGAPSEGSAQVRQALATPVEVPGGGAPALPRPEPGGPVSGPPAGGGLSGLIVGAPGAGAPGGAPGGGVPGGGAPGGGVPGGGPGGGPAGGGTGGVPGRPPAGPLPGPIPGVVTPGGPGTPAAPGAPGPAPGAPGKPAAPPVGAPLPADPGAKGTVRPLPAPEPITADPRSAQPRSTIPGVPTPGGPPQQPAGGAVAGGHGQVFGQPTHGQPPPGQPTPGQPTPGQPTPGAPAADPDGDARTLADQRRPRAGYLPGLIIDPTDLTAPAAGRVGRPGVPPGGDDPLALFLLYLFPPEHERQPAQRPARQVPPPPVEVDLAAGLRFPPADHPQAQLVTDADALAAVGAGRQPLVLPVGLPAEAEQVRALADGHDPLGGQHEREWARRFLVRDALPGELRAEYAWPPAEAFPEGACAPDTAEAVVLEPGTVLDRFGGPAGRVLAADGTPFGQRSLPPEYRWHGYHRYQVCRPLPVWRVLSAAWFGQPGGGVRYRSTHPVTDLVALDYLIDVTYSGGAG